MVGLNEDEELMDGSTLHFLGELASRQKIKIQNNTQHQRLSPQPWPPLVAPYEGLPTQLLPHYYTQRLNFLHTFHSCYWGFFSTAGSRPVGQSVVYVAAVVSVVICNNNQRPFPIIQRSPIGVIVLQNTGGSRNNTYCIRGYHGHTESICASIQVEGN